MKPVHSIRGPLDPSNLFLSLEEARQELGLFSDTSEDDLVTDLILTATERVSDVIGRPLTAITVTDFYSMLARRMELSNTNVSALTKFAGYTGTGEVSESSLVDIAHVLDVTGKIPTIMVDLDAIDILQFRSDLIAPYKATYTTDTVTEFPANQEQIRSGVRYMISVLYEARGTGQLHEGWQKGLMGLLTTATPVKV